MASPDAAADAVVEFRRFNRLYTRFLGTLNQGLLDTPFRLAEARVLYELATRKRPQAREIAAELGMDAGYLSRILAKLERAGLVRREASPRDRRAAHLQLTRPGRGAFRTLNLRSAQQAGNVLARLVPAEQKRLMGAFHTIEALALTPQPGQARFTLRTHRPGDMGMVIHCEGAGYADQFGWDESFEALVASIAADFVDHFDAQRERCWIAEIEGTHAGHIFLVRHPEEPGTAKLRLLYVEPFARGLGIGQALVAECIAFARACGYKKITLWTQSILLSARRIYQQAGFQLVHEEAHHRFGQNLTAQTWDLDLAERRG